MKRFVFFLLLVPCFQLLGQTDPDSTTRKKEQTIVTEPVTLPRGILRMGLDTRLLFPDKSFVDGKRQAHDENVWGSNLTCSLFAGYGVSDRLMIKVTIPYMREDYYETPLYLFPTDSDQQYSYPQRWKTQARGIGDVDVSVAYQLVQQTISSPAIATVLAVTLPTGRKDIIDDDDGNEHTYHLPTGQGEVSLETALILRKITYPYACGASVFYVYHSGTNKVLAPGKRPSDFQHGQTLGASASLNAHLNEAIAFSNRFDILRFGSDRINGEPTAKKGWLLQYFAGLSFQIRSFRLDQGMMIALKGDNAAADPAYHIALQYSF